MDGKARPRIWTTKTFDRLSKYYDWLMKSFFPIGEKGREQVVSRLKSGSVLDVACGTGTLLVMARDKGLKCYGVDLSRGMLDQAKIKVPEAELKQASFYELPYPDGCFDFVIETNALSGTFIDAKKALSEMLRVCKSGGRVCIAEWPKAAKENLMERLFVKVASLNDDAPKDYLKIFSDLGVQPEVEFLDKRYAIFSITKM